MSPSETIERATALGARVSGHPEHADEVVPHLRALLSSDLAAPELVAVIEALSHVCRADAVAAVLPYAGHADVRVRLATARALPGGASEDPAVAAAACTALIELSGDLDDEVRDWATFGLGAQLEVDGRAVREALLRRLDDASSEVRAEAIYGLARRRDRRVLDVLRAALADEVAGGLLFEAAALLADPTLLEVLRPWAGALPDDDQVATAVSRCDPAQRSAELGTHARLLEAVQARLDAMAPGAVATLFVDRFSDEVVLVSTGDPDLVGDVRTILARVGGDIEAAAWIVADPGDRR